MLTKSVRYGISDFVTLKTPWVPLYSTCLTQDGVDDDDNNNNNNNNNPCN
jgi:hypothetical protein